jgi:hypothetical protein
LELLLTGVLVRRFEIEAGDSDPTSATPTARVRELARQGMRPARIAKTLGMSRKDVHSILNRTQKR